GGPQVPADMGGDYRLGGGGLVAQSGTRKSELAGDHLIEREGRVGAVESGDHDNVAAARHRVDMAGGGLAAEHVEDEIGAAPGREFAGAGDDVLAVMADHSVGAELADIIGLAGAADDGD